MRMKILPLAAFALVLTLCACAADGGAETEYAEKREETAYSTVSDPGSIGAAPETAGEPETDGNEEDEVMQLMINDKAVAVKWEDNDSVEALRALCERAPLVINMSMYGGFEQVGPIGQSLPRDDVQTTTEAGDIVLYSGDQIVVFYGSNSWAYTRLGHITGMTDGELKKLLGSGDVTVTVGIASVSK